MERIKRVGIIGVGLLGSSLGLALKRFTEVTEVLGYDKDNQHIETALEIGAIDNELSIEEGENSNSKENKMLKKLDLVVLATPVGVISKLVQDIQEQLKSGVIITDVGSTKRKVINKIKGQLREDIIYIPGHPMTGSEISGPKGADAYLFENAIYVLTPLQDGNGKFNLLVELLEKIGAKLLFMSPKKHDQIVAAASHLPHIMACTLVDAVGKVAQEDERVFSLTAGGFRDTTRIASGDPIMWTDVCLSNSNFIREMISLFKDRLAEFDSLLADADSQGLYNKFNRIQSLREEIPKKKRGLISPVHEAVINISDHPNAIGEVTSSLGKAGINIVDIGILRVREEGGALRLVFSTAEELEEAKNILIKKGYKLQTK
ncbi:prephenate dehydrogenase [Selenihalanaerobacter shriftii]|uniref:Prephenate dehydrogenase n=1 Tax=Selenihalanaerobacter shriftii TaxID=142842 RepID=A0A1T4LJ88_9FIRM|nr:prephenate dehydrogenase [Selenihalanaerobacter shriftii]SJZ54638.1 prephenate dehydrogenase [Selenihalanaerobacter shriftii]